jgi:hypothetical protein
LEEIEEEEIENSSLEVKFEKKNDANAKVNEDESIPECEFDCKQNVNGLAHLEELEEPYDPWSYIPPVPQRPGSNYQTDQKPPQLIVPDKKNLSQAGRIKLEKPSYDNLNDVIESLDNTSFRGSLNEDALDDDYTSRGDSSNTPASRRVYYLKPQSPPQRNNELS